MIPTGWTSTPGLDPQPTGLPGHTDTPSLAAILGEPHNPTEFQILLTNQYNTDINIMWCLTNLQICVSCSHIFFPIRFDSVHTSTYYVCTHYHIHYYPENLYSNITLLLPLTYVNTGRKLRNEDGSYNWKLPYNYDCIDSSYSSH